MKKRKYKKANDCSWFDSQNARLIILCATLGIFGAHKFAQRKIFQGIIYILLDFTLVGIILTLIFSWFDLIFLTAKSNNRPGNMILGSAFIILESFIVIPGSYGIIVKNIDTESLNSVVAVETPEQNGVLEVSFEENGDINSEEQIVDVPMLVTEDGNVVSGIVTEFEPEKVVPFPESAKPIEQAKVEAPVKKEFVPARKSKEHITNEENPEDEFGSFSLYDMITGE